MRTHPGECPCGQAPPPDDDAHAGRCVPAFLASPGHPRLIVRAAVGGYLSAHPAALYRHADIESDAWWGMALALARYDPARGAAVRTWAEVRVRGAIIDGERTRAPLSRRAYQSGARRAEDPLSLDDVPWDRHGALDPALRRVEDRDVIARCLALLSERQAYALARTYLLGDTVGEVAADLGITESGVTRLRQAAIRDIHARLAEQREVAAADAADRDRLAEHGDRWLQQWADAAA